MHAHDLIETVYGGMPTAPRAVTAQLLHQHVAPQHHPLLPSGAISQSWRVRCALVEAGVSALTFMFQLYVPARVLPHCVIVCGDGCWRTLSDATLKVLLQSGLAVALFNRTDIAADRTPNPTQPEDLQRDSPIFEAEPEAPFGAISAWAWAYSRVVDALSTMRDLAGAPIAFTGHSRGGKAALLAGAIDARANWVHANNAGVLGSAPYYNVGEGSETWQALVRAYPHWVGAKLRALAASHSALAFEQDLLLAAISPRNVLITQATDDAWANPLGTAQLIDTLRPRFEGGLSLVQRSGAHPMLDEDWQVLRAFILEVQ